MARIPVAVARGASFLDDILPNWRKQIDPETLDQSVQSCCVLGQIFGDFDKGADILDLSDSQLRRYGFMNSHASFDKLTAAWRSLIERDA